MEKIFKIKVVTTDGKKLNFEIDQDISLEQLKELIFNTDINAKDFNFVYKGRRIRNQDNYKRVMDIMDLDSNVLHTVGADIKGGCV